MHFKLEALFARHGDALLLQYGESDDENPSWILIDGGAAGTYNDFLRPRLMKLKEDWQIDGAIPFKMILVSHTDSDHISGILDLYKELDTTTGTPICDADTLWHNAFDDVIGQSNDKQELVSKLIQKPDGFDESTLSEEEREDLHENDAVVSSVNQGRNLRIAADKMGTTLNSPFRNNSKPGLVLANQEAVELDKGLKFLVVAPNEDLVKEYQKKWNDFLEDKGLAEVEAAGFNDTSAFNLASIVVLAQLEGKTMLLTGDARGDFIVNGLVDTGFLEEEARYPVRQKGERKRDWMEKIKAADATLISKPLHVDLLKIPHHGSANNVEPGFFRRVIADHYIFSGNGNHHNPDPETLRMLADARGDDDYTLYFTFAENQHETELNDEFAKTLEELRDWVADEKPSQVKVRYRGENDLSIAVDLGS